MVGTQGHELGIVEAAAALAQGQLSSADLVEALLERIAALDGRLHAFALLDADRARAEARASDERRRRSASLGPLDGIPLAVKDAIDDTALPARFGNPALHRGRKGAASTVMERLAAAGAVRLGKLTLTEGVWVEHHATVPAPVNPHGAAHWTGTSSSGSGVALAAGLVPGSFGTDTGGSIRLPSGCCGVTGLKPSWGRISVRGVHPLAPSFDHVGPMARSARDVALLMDAVAGHDPADPTSLCDPVRPCRVEGRPSLHGLRLGWPAAEIAAADDQVCAAMDEAAAVLIGLGAEIVAVEMPDPAPVVAAWSVLCSAEAAMVHAGTYPARAEVYGPALTALIDRGRGRSGAEIIAAMAARRAQAGRMAMVHAGVDLLLLPALPVAGPSNAFMARFADDDAATQVIGRYTVPYSMCGLPTLTLPCGRSAEGIPIGLQLCGARLDEPLLCRVGAAFQSVTGWHAAAPV